MALLKGKYKILLPIMILLVFLAGRNFQYDVTPNLYDLRPGEYFELKVDDGNGNEFTVWYHWESLFYGEPSGGEYYRVLLDDRDRTNFNRAFGRSLGYTVHDPIFCVGVDELVVIKITRRGRFMNQKKWTYPVWATCYEPYLIREIRETGKISK